MINMTIVDGVGYIIDTNKQEIAAEIHTEINTIFYQYLTTSFLCGLAVGLVCGYLIKIYLDKRKKK